MPFVVAKSTRALTIPSIHKPFLGRDSVECFFKYSRLFAVATVNPTSQHHACVLQFCYHSFICSETAHSLFLRSCSTASEQLTATTVGALVYTEMQ